VFCAPYKGDASHHLLKVFQGVSGHLATPRPIDEAQRSAALPVRFPRTAREWQPLSAA